MGVNAQTSVPAFTAGQVLTAAEMTEVNTGIPVFADSTARDAAFGGTGEKVLAEGQYAYLESTNATQVYDGSNWVSVGVSPGMVLVKSQVIGTTVASVTVSDAFSATYDAYKITITGGLASTNSQINLTFGSASSGYSFGYLVAAASPSGVVNASASSIPVGECNTVLIQMNTEVFNPFLTKHTYVNGTLGFNAVNGNGRAGLSGYLTDSVSYTAFTLTANTGTLTGGTIRVYGYANS